MREERSWRALAVVAGLFGLLAVVAIAAAGRTPGGGDSRPSAHAPSLLIDYLATLALLAVPAGFLVYVWSMFMRRANMVREGPRRRGVRRLRSLAPTFLILVLVAVAVRWGIPDFRHSPASKPASAATVQANAKGKHKIDNRGQPTPYQPQFRWLPMVAVGLLILGIGGSMGLLALRRRREWLPKVPVTVALSAVLSETLDDLRGERDPRQAVIRAYARMERTMAAGGVPRRESEAPFEYLARMLDVVQVSAHSARRLTQLFERARFSPHAIDGRMKQDAIEALSGVRAELEVEVAH